MTKANIKPLTSADIPEIMRIERLPGYDAVVGRFDAEEHAEQFAKPDARYFGVRDGERLSGFVIMQELGEPTALLRRIAVDGVDRGTGTRLLRGVMDWVFEETPATGMKLEVAHGNARAKRVYAREGFVEYGADAIHCLMSVPRARWAELKRAR